MTVPVNPTKYRGPNVYLANIVTRDRPPTLADYRQPETGKYYVIFCGWQVGRNPVSGTEGDLWLLTKIVANQGYWIKISSGVTPSGAVLSLSDTANTLVFPTAGGNIQLEAGVGLTITSVPLSNKLTFALAGGGGAVDSFAMQTGTSPVVADGAGLVTFNGATVSAGTNPVRTHGTAATTMALEVQISQALAATDATKIGLSNYDSVSFAVDANGFVTLAGGGGFTWLDVSGAFSPLRNHGYFITGTATANLPASPAQGDTIKFFVDHASQVLTIQAAGTQIIRLGSLVSSAGGTFVSTLQGDSVELTYRAANTCWEAIAGFTGTFTLT